MPKPLYIVAGNHKQAQWLARDLQLAPNQWVYIHRKDQLKGIRSFLYTTFGSAWENPVTRMGEDLKLANAIFVKHSELHQVVQAGILR